MYVTEGRDVRQCVSLYNRGRARTYDKRQACVRERVFACVESDVCVRAERMCICGERQACVCERERVYACVKRYVYGRAERVCIYEKTHLQYIYR